MDLAEALRRRRMIRHYTGAPVPAEILERIVAAGLSAPTAGDSQGVAIVSVTSPERIAAVAAACGEGAWTARGRRPWISTAGALLVICLEPEVYRERYSRPDKDPGVLSSIPWWWVDGGAALEAILLAAVAAGLGAGFLGGHRAAAVHSQLGLPHDALLLGIVTLGQPDPSDVGTRRRSLRRHRHHREVW